jgi:Immunity protein 70
MGVGIRVGSIIDEIGSGSFLHAFFSTVSVHGEPGGWGSRFPTLMNRLYQGNLPADSVSSAIAELADAKSILATLPPSEVVWDIENRAAKPPWGDNISPTITNLGNYFVTSTGRDLFAVLEEALNDAAAKGWDATIE